MVEMAARHYIRTLNLPEAYLNPEFDRCYCSQCYPPNLPSAIPNEAGAYVVPQGWFRFGLKAPPRANANDVFNQWCVSLIHGVKGVAVLNSILKKQTADEAWGQLMKPGDKLLDGSVMRSTECAGRQDKVYYASPKIRYAGLKFYAEPKEFAYQGTQLACIALQCVQNPTILRKQSETMQFKKKWPGHLEQSCGPYVNLQHVKWMSDANTGTIPYGILIRCYKPRADPEAE